MSREIRIKITPEGKVEVDSSIFEDCREVAEHLSRVLGKVELFTVKEEEFEAEERIKVETSD